MPGKKPPRKRMSRQSSGRFPETTRGGTAPAQVPSLLVSERLLSCQVGAQVPGDMLGGGRPEPAFQADALPVVQGGQRQGELPVPAETVDLEASKTPVHRHDEGWNVSSVLDSRDA
jgi:hypothetical protein